MAITTVIAALHNPCAVRIPTAALYYSPAMVDAGEDPLYLGRGWCAWRRG